MKIAALVPIGRLDKYGYQYHYKTILENISAFADKIFFSVTSSFVDKNQLAGLKNFEIITDPKNVLERDKKTDKETLNFKKLNDNMNDAVGVIKKQGYDACVEIHINQYIPELSHSRLRSTCEQMIALRKPYEWLYKRYQIGNRLFHTNVRLPWILNLTMDTPYKLSADSITDKKTGARIMIEDGDFRRFNNQAIVDVFESMTLADAREKYDFTIEELRKLTGKFNPNDRSNMIFNEEEWTQYQIAKMNQKKISQEKLDSTGTKIVGEMKPEFLCMQYIKHYAPVEKNLLKKIFRLIQGKNSF